MELLWDYAMQRCELEGMGLFDFILTTHEGKASGNQGDSDKAIYGFKIYKISIITIRITYHQTKVD